MSGPAPGAISIAKGTGRCAATGHDIEPGQAYFAARVDSAPAQTDDVPATTGTENLAPTDTPAAGANDPEPAPKPASVGGLALQRVDVSADAWADGYRPAGLFGYWKTVAREGDEPRTRLDTAALTHLLRSMALSIESAEDAAAETDGSDGASAGHRAAFVFLVALLLVRKRMLRVDQNQPLDDGGERWTLMPKRDPSKGPMSKWDDGEPIVVVRPPLQEDDLAAAADELAEVLDDAS
ncbi:MAG: hypothetical protein AAF288_01270 [Planctomycetota bacterium]